MEKKGQVLERKTRTKYEMENGTVKDLPKLYSNQHFETASRLRKIMYMKGIMVKDMGDAMGIYPQTVTNKLKNPEKLRLNEIRAFLLLTGLSFEEAFKTQVKEETKYDDISDINF